MTVILIHTMTTKKWLLPSHNFRKNSRRNLLDLKAPTILVQEVGDDELQRRRRRRDYQRSPVVSQSSSDPDSSDSSGTDEDLPPTRKTSSGQLASNTQIILNSQANENYHFKNSTLYVLIISLVRLNKFFLWLITWTWLSNSYVRLNNSCE
jgi:hypothetical protein